MDSDARSGDGSKGTKEQREMEPNLEKLADQLKSQLNGACHRKKRRK